MRAILAVLLLGLGLAGCTEPGTYPLTGEPCEPDDPVADLDAGACTPPGAAGAGLL